MSRAATVDDVAAVRMLEVMCFGADAWSEQSVLEELTGPRRLAVVACEPAGGQVVGYAVISDPEDSSHLHVVPAQDGGTREPVDLHRIVVHPSWRRRGLAGDLLATVRPGERRMVLEVSAGNRAAQDFYAAAGFDEIGRRSRYYRDGSDAVVMEWAP